MQDSSCGADFHSFPCFICFMFAQVESYDVARKIGGVSSWHQSSVFTVKHSARQAFFRI